jgi:hypothetical protein
MPHVRFAMLTIPPAEVSGKRPEPQFLGDSVIIPIYEQ